MTNDLPSQSQSPQLLRSCLRQGSFSRGISNNERRRGVGGGSIRTYSSAPSQAMLQYEYSQQQQQQQHQARQEESCSRSAVSDPVRMTREYNLRTRSPSYASSSSYPIVTPPMRNTNNTSNGRDHNINVVEDSERQFMRISQLLHSQHMTASGGGRHNDSSYALQLIFQHLPTIELRLSFYNSLQRNSQYLPIFPEANEHPSIALTRYIEKIFGPILAREIKTGSSNSIVVGGYCQSPTMSYATQRYPQHYLQSSPHQNDLSDVYHRQQQSQQSPHSQSMLSPSLSMSRHPHHLAERPCVDEPLFPPPSTSVNQYTEINSTHQACTINNHKVSHLSLQITNPPFEQLWNSNDPSVAIPSSPAVSRTGSGAPTPMASNISTKITAPILYQQPLNVTFASPQSESDILSPPYSPPTSSKSQSRRSFSFASPLNNNNNKVYTTTTTTELSSPVDDRSSVNTPSLLGISTESSNPSEEEEEERGDNNDGGDSKYDNIAITPRTKKCINEITTESSVVSVMSISNYQTLSNKDMLPPMKSRESILYYPNHISTKTTTTTCCDGVPSPSRHGMIRKRPPSYLQLYVKCERSEPFINKDLDIVTWYRNASDSRVTAERTLVVRNTTNMIDLIGGIIESFGLTSPPSTNNTDDNDNGIGKELSQGCYKSVCFISDVKTRESEDTAMISLTPLPIPGLRYKYVDRSSSEDDTSKAKDNSSSSSSVLAMDPYGLRLTLVGQLLDKSIHKYPSSVSSSSSSSKQFSNSNEDHYAEGVRNRLALVFCTPKRRAYISPRSTIQGVLPETIYHFQLILEGVVSEDNLPSSFQSQTAIRCVSATGGVLGGSVIDTKDEINELNRKLWKGRDVVGLSTPKANRYENLERIIDILGVPLFDVAGNQTPKEFVVDRCLYDMYSGKLSMNFAQKTQDTVEAIEGTTEWLARRVDDIAKTLTACDDSYGKFERGKFDEFDAAVSRFESKFIK